MIGRPQICAALVLGAAAVAGLLGCGRDSTTGPYPVGTKAIVLPSPRVVTPVDSLSLVDVEDSLLIFDMQGSPPAGFGPGSVLVGTVNDGFLRKVASASVRGGRLYVGTTPAYLTDFVMFCAIDTVVEAGFGSSAKVSLEAPGPSPGDGVRLAPGVSLAGNVIDLSGAVLYSGAVDGETLSVAIPKGHLAFSPDFRLQLEIDGRQVTRFGAEASGGLDLAFDATVASSGSVTLSREVPLASFSRQVTLHIGSVPVIETITISIVAGFSIDEGFVGTASVGADGSGPVTLGARYAGYAWSPLNNAEFHTDPHGIVYASNDETSFAVYVEPRLDVSLYGMPCCGFDWKSSLNLTERDIGFPVLSWSLGGGLELDDRFEPTVIDRTMTKCPPFLSSSFGVLASGPYHTDDYVYVGSWGSEGTGAGQFEYPKGIAIDNEGNIYIADNWANKIQKFGPAGEPLLQWGSSGTAPGQFNSPEKLAIDAAANVYVVDGVNNRVQKFSSSGEFLTAWGSEGSGAGQFKSPVGIAVSGGVVYVTDLLNSRVERFTTDGAYLGAWGEAGAGAGQFDGPLAVRVEPSGLVLVTDCHNYRVQLFTPDGGFVGAWGAFGSGDEQFDCPIDIADDADGNRYVADIGNDRILKFDPSGAFLTKLGSTGSGEGQFDHPEGLAVDRQGTLYVVDARNRRVEVFAPRVH
jgi:DNA-binding beta-propeller fold protein YncE